MIRFVALNRRRRWFGSVGSYRTKSACGASGYGERRAEDVLNGLESLYKNGVDLEKFAHQFVQLVRDLLLIKVSTNPGRFVEVDESELTRMSSLVEVLTPSDLQRILGTLLRHFDEMPTSFPKVRLELALLEVCEQGRTLPLQRYSSRSKSCTGVSIENSARKKTESRTGEPGLAAVDVNTTLETKTFDAPSSVEEVDKRALTQGLLATPR